MIAHGTVLYRVPTHRSTVHMTAATKNKDGGAKCLPCKRTRRFPSRWWQNANCLHRFDISRSLI